MSERNKQTDSPEKNAAGISAAKLVKDGDILGLGTGSTVLYTIKELGRRIREEGLKIKGIPTSFSTEEAAINENIPLTSFSHTPYVDIAIDGADMFDADFYAIKGGGAAHTREKVVAYSAKRFVLVADEKKKSEKLNMPVPVEILPFSKLFVMEKIKEAGGIPVLRLGAKKDGPVITDNGNFILDCDFKTIENPEKTAQILNEIPGIVEHGIFKNVSEIHIGKADGTVEILKKK
ncbi:MAG: ribose-5-phosphate isomerase RpiA [Methanosarcinaceae archaeon]|nr:ribose-5-phosphate isomerase RpiA [Methanosarcinaceae archaeon]